MIATPSLDRDALRRKSAPLLLCERARRAPDSIAFRSKHLGLYRERSWRSYAALVARAARAFATLGLRGGDRIAIMGDPCEEWLICDLAAQSLGAIVYGASANDPLVVCAVVLTMLATGILSAALPARRALGIEPASLLREE